MSPVFESFALRGHKIFDSSKRKASMIKITDTWSARVLTSKPWGAQTRLVLVFALLNRRDKRRNTIPLTPKVGGHAVERHLYICFPSSRARCTMTDNVRPTCTCESSVSFLHASLFATQHLPLSTTAWSSAKIPSPRLARTKVQSTSWVPQCPPSATPRLRP